MIVKKTYIPSKPRNKKLTNVATGGSVSGISKTEIGQIAGSTHEHPNKTILDRLTDEMLNAAERDLIVSDDNTTELSDENILSSLRVIAEIIKNNETLKSLFLSKVNPDTAKSLIKFLQGIEIGTFTPGLLGSGAKLKMNNGISELEVDKLLVRMRAEFFSVLIHEAKSVGGQQVFSAANMICNKVEETTDFYRCYFDRGENNEVNNLFENTDRARCQVFSGSGQKFYWRKVVAVGSDYIELSKTDMASGVNDIPAVGDHIQQLSSDNPDRQGAIIISTVGDDAPFIKQYANISGYSLVGKETTVFTRKGNRIVGKTVFLSDGSNIEDWASGTSQDIQDSQAAANAADLKAQQAIDNAAANVTDYNAKFAAQQAQIDGVVDNWFYPYSPTLSNYPASEWTNNTIKDRHIGDTFTNTQQAPATDAGKSWRFVKNGTVYSWTQIADSDAVLALQKAAQALSAADGKSTTSLIQPTSYKLGDMWVLAADQTVNGIAYKQGEILTATQDSATFVEAHWVKKVRYTDDTAVNNLQIGSRNYLRNSIQEGGWGSNFFDSDIINYGNGYVRFTTPSDGNYSGGVYRPILTTEELIGKNVVFSFDAYSNGGDPATVYINGNSERLIESLTTSWMRYYLPIKNFQGGSIVITNLYANRYYFFRNFKIVVGDKDVESFTESPEDVQARMTASIAQSKSEAEAAAKDYSDAQDNAKQVETKAYADGKVTAEEQRAINDANAKLAAAKAYSDAKDSELKTQQESYVDGKVTAAEQAAINTAKAYSDLKKTEAQAYADGKVTAEEQRAIADAQAKLNEAKAHAAQLDANLQIGGRNYLRNSIMLGWGINVYDGTWVDYYEDHILLTTPNSGSLSYGIYKMASTTENLIGKNVVFSFDAFSNSADDDFIVYITGNGDRLNAKTELLWKRYYLPIKNFQGGHIVITSLTPNRFFYFRNLKIVVGDKDVESFTESPEDIQARIDAEKTRINEILSDNIADPSEKQYLSNLWQEIYAEYPRYWAQANTHGIDKTNYEAKYTALNNLLSPVLANLTVNTSVSGASIRTAFNQYYDARAVLINAVTNKVNTVAAGALATANETAAKTQFQTQIDGGLIYTALMKLVDVVTKAETAGISGQPGDGNLPAFWAGGTYTQAIQGLAKAIIRHNGKVKFSDAEIEGTIKAIAGYIGDVSLDAGGKLYINDADGVERLRIGNYNLTPLSTLRAAAQTTKQQTFTGKSFNWSSGEGLYSDTYTSPQALVLASADAGSDITITGELYASVEGRNTSASIQLLLKRAGAVVAAVDLVEVDEYSSFGNKSVNLVFRSMAAGSYTLEMKYFASYFRDPGMPLEIFSTSAQASNLKMVSVLRNDMKAIHIALNGLMAFYDKNKLLYLDEKATGNDPFLSIMGVTDMPGVLCAGRVNATGVIQTAWGAKKNRQGQSSPVAEKISGATGRYRVYHNIGHTDYIPKLTGGVWYYQGNRRAGCPGWENIQASYFDVFMMSDGGNVIDCAFSYECIGNNY